MSKLFQETLDKIRPINTTIGQETQRRLDSLTKPPGSLGRLEDLAKQMASITGSLSPVIDKKAVLVMAGDHGVVRDGVSAYPQEVTMQMVLNFLGGGAAINVLAGHIGAEVQVINMGVAAELESHPNL